MTELIIPPRVYSKKQWITLSKRCRDELIEKHGFKAEDFCRVGDDVPSMCWTNFYPKEWRRNFKHVEANWIKESAIPAGLVLHWPRGLDCTGEAYDPDDPAQLLAEVRYWERFDYDAYWREQEELERHMIESGAI